MDIAQIDIIVNNIILVMFLPVLFIIERIFMDTLTHLDNIREHDGIVSLVVIIFINGIMVDGNIVGVMDMHIDMNGYIILY